MTWSIDYTYLTSVITHMQPILTRELPIIGTALVLWFIIKLKN